MFTSPNLQSLLKRPDKAASSPGDSLWSWWSCSNGTLIRDPRGTLCGGGGGRCEWYSPDFEGDTPSSKKKHFFSTSHLRKPCLYEKYGVEIGMPRSYHRSHLRAVVRGSADALREFRGIQRCGGLSGFPVCPERLLLGRLLSQIGIALKAYRGVIVVVLLGSVPPFVSHQIRREKARANRATSAD